MTSSSNVIIGIDPGSRAMGYGVVACQGNHYRYVASGCIRMRQSSVPERLQQIFVGTNKVIETHRPIEAAIEQVFMHRNPNSALKLGQARGVAIVALASQGLPVSEYTPRRIKQSVVGYGAADKEQVQFMIKKLLNLSGDVQADAADALAIALCHAYGRET